MSNRKRNIEIRFRVTPEEKNKILKKCEQAGITNLTAYLRKIAIDGYVLKLEIPELKEIISLLRYSSNNLNQLTRRAHETGRIYDSDLEDIHRSLEKIWDAMNTIIKSLAKI